MLWKLPPVLLFTHVSNDFSILFLFCCFYVLFLLHFSKENCSCCSVFVSSLSLLLWFFKFLFFFLFFFSYKLFCFVFVLFCCFCWWNKKLIQAFYLRRTVSHSHHFYVDQHFVRKCRYFEIAFVRTVICSKIVTSKWNFDFPSISLKSC